MLCTLTKILDSQWKRNITYDAFEAMTRSPPTWAVGTNRDRTWWNWKEYIPHNFVQFLEGHWFLCSAFFLLLVTDSQKAIYTIKSAKIRSYLKDFQSPCFGQNLRKKLPLFYTWYRVSSPKHIYRDVEQILLSYLATNLIFLSIINTFATSQNWQNKDGKIINSLAMSQNWQNKDGKLRCISWARGIRYAPHSVSTPLSVVQSRTLLRRSLGSWVRYKKF
jgi:hypothetical protein